MNENVDHVGQVVCRENQGLDLPLNEIKLEIKSWRARCVLCIETNVLQNMPLYTYIT